MKISYLNLKKINAPIFKKINCNFSKISSYIAAAGRTQFEHNFSNYVNAKYCLGIANGVDAIKLSLLALDIKVGDEVIVPSNTFIGTWLPISHCGAKIIPVEPNIKDYNISPKNIEKAITKKTKAIIIVHLYGYPCDIFEIKKIAKKYNIHLIEDAAQAHGSEYLNKKIGSHSDVVAWSFYPSKNLGAMGDAGAITTNNYTLYKKIKLLRNYGSEKKYINRIIGFNSRLDIIQGIFLNEKLNCLEKWNKKREALAQYYIKALSKTKFIFPEYDSKKKLSSWYAFVIRHPKRDKLFNWLKNNGIETLIHYPLPPYKQQCYSKFFKRKKFPISDEIHNTCLSLPCNHLISKSEQKYIISKLLEFDKKN